MSCSQQNFTQRLTNDAKSYGKRKKVATFVKISQKCKIMNEHLAQKKALRRKIASVNPV